MDFLPLKILIEKNVLISFSILSKMSDHFLDYDKFFNCLALEVKNITLRDTLTECQNHKHKNSFFSIESLNTLSVKILTSILFYDFFPLV